MKIPIMFLSLYRLRLYVLSILYFESPSDPKIVALGNPNSSHRLLRSSARPLFPTGSGYVEVVCMPSGSGALGRAHGQCHGVGDRCCYCRFVLRGSVSIDGNTKDG